MHVMRGEAPIHVMRSLLIHVRVPCTGPLPASMSKLTKLEKLWASGNRLRGTLNDPLRALTRLVDVQVTAPSHVLQPCFSNPLHLQGE